MIYNDFKNLKLSSLGMGCMRFPTRVDNNEIDIEKTAKMIELCFKNGINYFDTAWGYHEGKSEIVLGELLKKYPRDSFYLASKFPGFDLANIPKVKEIFLKQLEKCQTDYFDFYLFHNVCEMNVNEYLDPQYGILDYLLEQKKIGKIKHLGFSAHGNIATMKKFLDAYGDEMEFCQIQLNWLDWSLQNAKAKLELLEKYNIPVWVMEPLRGGKLCNLEEKYSEKLNSSSKNMNATEWSFRFLQKFSNVKVILSGMSNIEQLKENIAIFSEFKPLSESETETLLSVAESIMSVNTVHCTACRYCTDHCPKELNIPWLLELYNESINFGNGFMIPMAMKSVDDDKKPTACISCRSCEAVCPQNIKISEVLNTFSALIK